MRNSHCGLLIVRTTVTFEISAELFPFWLDATFLHIVEGTLAVWVDMINDATMVTCLVPYPYVKKKSLATHATHEDEVVILISHS